MRRNFLPRFLATAALFIGTSLVASCDGCGAGDPGESSVDNGAPAVVLPQTPTEVTEWFAQRTPRDVDLFVAIRDWNALSTTWTGLRPRVEASFAQLGMIETDLRNTLAIDPADPASLDRIGLARPGGAAFVLSGDDGALLLLVSRETQLVEHLQKTLQAPPWALSAPVEESLVAGRKALRFRKVAGGPVEFTLVVDQGTAFLVAGHDARNQDAFLVRFLTAGMESVATTAGFTETNSPANADATLIAVADFAHYAEQNAARIERSAGRAGVKEADRGLVGRTIGRMGQAGVVGRLTPTGLDLQLSLAADAAALARLKGSVGEACDGQTSRLVNKDTYSFIRLSIQPAEILRFLQNNLPATLRTDMDAILGSMATTLGAPLEESLYAGLGNEWFVVATRARLLTLNKFLGEQKVADLFGGIGLAAAVPVKDRAKVDAGLNAVVAALAGRAHRFEAGGNSIVEFSDPAADIGNFVLTPTHLLLVPARQRDEFLGQLAGAPAALPFTQYPTTTRLCGADPANGLYIDFRQIDEGPIGQVAFARMKEDTRRLLGAIGEISVVFVPQQERIFAHVDVRFRPLPTPPPAQ